jgi:uncharacterized protein YbjT (DUF2867 family)
VRSGLDDLSALRRLVQGADAVLYLLGPRPPHRDVFCAAATRTLPEAMAGEHVERLLCLTGAMVAPDPRHVSLPLRAFATAFRPSRPDVAADRASQERLVRESALRWTSFKPPRLTIARRTGRLLVGPRLRVGLLSSVSREALAGCLLDAAEQGLHVGEAVYLSAA